MHSLLQMETRAQVKAVLPSEARDDGTATLPIELDVMPGAVWRSALQSLLPADMRVSLFEQGGRKCALITFAVGHEAQALATFEAALQEANEVSEQAHSAAASERRARSEPPP
jgi:hypothetical protein